MPLEIQNLKTFLVDFYFIHSTWHLSKSRYWYWGASISTTQSSVSLMLRWKPGDTLTYYRSARECSQIHLIKWWVYLSVCFAPFSPPSLMPPISETYQSILPSENTLFQVQNVFLLQYSVWKLQINNWALKMTVHRTAEPLQGTEYRHWEKRLTLKSLFQRLHELLHM